jgi:uncharacterized protein YndB with AHSA1/START domain
VATESILISEVIPASPQRIFSAWMDSAEHSAFTGEAATIVPTIGGEHSAGGGFIQGRTLELHEGSRIVQSWRTTEFPAESPDSRLEVTLEPTLGGTLVTLLHTDIPTGQGDRYKQGWNEYYLSRMKTYFTGGDLDRSDDDGDGTGEAANWEDETGAGGTQPAVVRPRASAKRTPAAQRPKTVAAKAAKTKAAPVKAAATKAKPVAKAKPALKKPAAKARPAAKAKPALKAKPKRKMTKAKPARRAAATKPKQPAKARARRR